ncbi:hypothetical protein ACOZ38_29395 [Sphaerisporangium viridialbum]|uniref:hypothetical protein n=1 Tax=Sphaerisporangium viridialbum TaxID=46189 RepID=UPI003C75AC2D
MPIAVVFLIALWVACMYFGFLYVCPVVGVLTLVAATLVGAGQYFLRAGRVLLPATADGPSAAVPGGAGAKRDPAYRHYGPGHGDAAAHDQRPGLLPAPRLARRRGPGSRWP